MLFSIKLAKKNSIKEKTVLKEDRVLGIFKQNLCLTTELSRRQYPNSGGKCSSWLYDISRVTSRSSLPIEPGSLLMLFSRILKLVSFVKFPISSPTSRIRLNRKYKVVTLDILYTPAGISVKRLWRKSKTCKFCKLDIESGNDVMTFSDNANVVKFVKQPVRITIKSLVLNKQNCPFVKNGHFSRRCTR